MKAKPKRESTIDQSPGGRALRREIQAVMESLKQQRSAFSRSARCAKCAGFIPVGDVFLLPHPAATVEQPICVRVCPACAEEEDSTP